jgi:hypothetical protein
MLPPPVVGAATLIEPKKPVGAEVAGVLVAPKILPPIGAGVAAGAPKPPVLAPLPPPNIEVVEASGLAPNESAEPKMLLVGAVVAGAAVDVGEQMLNPWKRLSAGVALAMASGTGVFSAADVNENPLAVLATGATVVTTGGCDTNENDADEDVAVVVIGAAGAAAALNAAPNENDEVVAIGFLMSAELTTAGDAIVGGF